MELATFLLFGLLAVASAVAVVAHRNPVHSVMSLVVTLFSTAVLFVLLGAPFVALLQVLIYAGAILVLFLFVLMLLNVGREMSGVGGLQRWAALGGAALFGALLCALYWAPAGAAPPPPLTEEAVALRPLARFLLSELLLPFEVMGLLLLAAVIAATLLARRQPAAAGEERR